MCSDPEMIGKRLAALANAAALTGRPSGYLVWGVEDGTHRVMGTTFKPAKSKKGGEALINWLMRMVTPQVDFHFHEWTHQGKPMVLLEVPATTPQPISFSGQEYIRIDSHTKPLKEHPERERALWAMFSRHPFEVGIAKADVSSNEVLSLIDFASCFDLLKIPLPTDRNGILARLADEKLIVRKPGARFDITNMGAMLFAKVFALDRLSRKALRIIKYTGAGRTKTEREWHRPAVAEGIRTDV